MSLEQLYKQLSEQQDKLPPVEQWDPPNCGEMDIRIAHDGQWYYQQSLISRQRLVTLLASVLKKQHDDYFLVTPVEKIKIKVDDQPFVITQWQWLEDTQPATMLLTTNLGDRIILNSDAGLELNDDGSLQVIVRRNLKASIHRNVFYQWVDLATVVEHDHHQQLYIHSAGHDHLIGELSNN